MSFRIHINKSPSRCNQVTWILMKKTAQLGVLYCEGMRNSGFSIGIASLFASGNAKQRRTEKRLFIAALQAAYPGVEVRT